MYRQLLSVACFALQLIPFGTELLDAQASTPVDKSSLPDNPQPQTRTPSSAQASSAAQTREEVDAPWPRELDRGDEKIAMYQPQLETWEGERLRAYAALAVAKKDNKPKYGVVWFQARTEVRQSQSPGNAR